MTLKLPKLQFHRDLYITLNEGFDRVGRFMFPQDWTGHEAFAWPKSDSNVLANEKSRLKNVYQLHRRLVQSLRTSSPFDASEEEQIEHHNLLTEAEDNLETARQELDQFGQGFDFRYCDARAYERRRAVESHLCNIVRSRELNLHFSHGFRTEMASWFKSDRFHLSFAFSFVLAPTSHGNRRRLSAYFNKQKFNAWALPFERPLAQFKQEPLEEQILEWFIAYRTECMERSRKVWMEDAQRQCRKYFESADFNQNSNAEFATLFKSVWMLLSKPEMKRKGRKPNVG